MAITYTQSRATTESTVKSCDYADYTLFDGYDWASVQMRHGYHVMHEVGEHPYNIFVNGVNQESGAYVIKEYTEHDVKTWTYAPNDAGKQEYTWHLQQLRAEALEDVEESSIDGYGKITMARG